MVRVRVPTAVAYTPDSMVRGAGTGIGGAGRTTPAVRARKPISIPSRAAIRTAFSMHVMLSCELPILAALARVDVDALCMTRAYDTSIFGANAHAAAGLCAFRLGRYDDSAMHYARAEALAPDRAEFRLKRQLAEARGAR